ncbi:MAG: lamin tail domain-containing protein [Bacteroidota bacterium]
MRPVFLVFFSLLFSFLSVEVSGQIVINEIMANNQKTIADTDGDYSDWIELTNTTGVSVNLTGYKLSDNPDSLNKWVFPSVNLPAGGYLRIWCSNKNRISSPFHTNFTIDAQGEDIYLSSPTAVIDFVAAVYMPADISFGRLPSGNGNGTYLSSATPVASNNSAIALLGALRQKPLFSIPGGFYTDSQAVFMSHPDSTVVIRYTTDGSDPTESSPVYTGPVTVRSRTTDSNFYSLIRTCYNVHFWLPDWKPPIGQVFKSTPLRARAFKNGYIPGPVRTETYFVDPNMATRYGSFPVVSVVSDPKNLFNDTTGIYVPGITYQPGTFNANYYEDWKRQANIEMYEPDGEQAFNGNFKVSVNGASSASSPQKGLNVNANSDYGPDKIRYPIFRNTPGKAKYITDFDKMKIRAWGSDRRYGLFRDAYAASFMHKTGLDYEAYRPCVVFINGEYWGLQEIRERNREISYLEEHYLLGNTDAKFDIVDMQTNEIIEGDTAQWNALRSYIDSHNMADSAVWAYVNSQVDLNSFLLHYMFSIYLSRGDWPAQNEAVWRQSNSVSSRWKWFMWDFDNTTAYYLNPWFDKLNETINGSRGYGPSPFLVAFLDNPQFRYDFVNIFCDWMNTEFLPPLMRSRVDSMKLQFAPFMQEYQARWQTNYTWTNQPDSMKWWVNLRPQFCHQHMQSRLTLPVYKRLTLNVSDTAKGFIKANTVVLDANTPRITAQTFPWSGNYYPTVPVPVTAIARPGYRFLYWLPTFDTSKTVRILLTSDTSLTAVFDIDPGYTTRLPLVINEVMTSNLLAIPDNYGEYDDWLEIYNPNRDTVDVAGFYLSDNLILPTRFRFAMGNDSTKIPPYGHLLVWADNDTEQGVLHTNFKFNATGDLVLLYRTDGETMEDSLMIPSLPMDVSLGCVHDGAPQDVFFSPPTPGATNAGFSSQQVFINELQSSNVSTVADANGEYDPWFEIYNPNPDTLDINGWFVSDDANPNKYRLNYEVSDFLIPPGGFLLMWADDSPSQGSTHVGFRMDNSPACITLSRPDLSLGDSVCYGVQVPDESWGRQTDGAPLWNVFFVPTPGASNIDINSNLNHTDLGRELRVFPNPVDGGIVRLNMSTNFKVYDNFGAVILEKNSSDRFSVSGFKAGIYLIHTEEGQSARLVIQ